MRARDFFPVFMNFENVFKLAFDKFLTTYFKFKGLFYFMKCVCNKYDIQMIFYEDERYRYVFMIPFEM